MLIKVGISGLDFGGAIKNVDSEIGNPDFEQVAKSAGEDWKELILIPQTPVKHKPDNKAQGSRS